MQHICGILFLSLLLTSPASALFGLFDSDSLAAGSRYAFVASQTEARIVAIDTQEDEIAAELELANIATSIMISDSLNLLVATHADSSSLTLIDLESRQNLPALDIGMIADTGLLNPLDQYMAFGNKQGQVSVWDMNAREQMFQINDLGSAINLTFSIDGTRLFVVEPTERQISVIGMNARKKIAEIILPEVNRSIDSGLTNPQDAPKITAISRSADGHTGFLSITSENKVIVLDLLKLSIKQTIAVDAEPMRPFSTADNRYVLIPHRAAKSIYVLDALSLAIRGNIKIGLPARELNTGWLDTVAFAMSAEDERIAVVDLQKLTLEQTLTLSGRPDDGLVTSDSKRLYTALLNTNTVARIDARSRKVLEITTNTPGLGNIEIAISNNICH
ncbi:MAG: hypothetical protein HOM55_04525 [Proteobacteria bacterium]|jgi:DNA-binding beta-propeller fold protein YncE|nr:hypothetical protein [Pseudomonadota bacterium]